MRLAQEVAHARRIAHHFRFIAGFLLLST